MTSWQNIPRGNSAWVSELRLGGALKLSLVWRHVRDRDSWVLHCAPWFDTTRVGPDTLPLEEAQNLALAKVREKIDSINAALCELS